MPPINQAALSVGVIAVSVAVAAAIAVYESPELRRMADDVRRRIAIALHSLGENIEPPTREPRFNRPEDAEGFLHSRADPGVDADDETKRRQREELMYWNSVRLQKEKGSQRAAAANAETSAAMSTSSFERNSMYGSTFDDFLQRDDSDDRGAYVFNTGADVVRGTDEGLVRRHAPQGVRGLNSSLYANPFADENGIELEEQHPVMHPSIMTPGKHEVMSVSDLYHATEPTTSPSRACALPEPDRSHRQHPQNNISSVLFDAADHVQAPSPAQPQQHQQSGAFDTTSISNTSRSHTMAAEEQDGSEGLRRDEYVTAGQDDRRDDVYASIQAWAQNSATSNPFAPMSASSPSVDVPPSAPPSEPELVSEGVLTPTDSVSVIATDDFATAHGGEDGNVRHYDVLSNDSESEVGDGIATPVSWSEIGSVVSESDAGLAHA